MTSFNDNVMIHLTFPIKFQTSNACFTDGKELEIAISHDPFCLYDNILCMSRQNNYGSMWKSELLYPHPHPTPQKDKK